MWRSSHDCFGSDDLLEHWRTGCLIAIFMGSTEVICLIGSVHCDTVGGEGGYFARY